MAEHTIMKNPKLPNQYAIRHTSVGYVVSNIAVQAESLTTQNADFATKIATALNALEGYNPDAVRDVVEALRLIAEPIDKSKAVGDPWAYYSDLQNIAHAALARLGGAS